ncbi:hypothetical protein [Brevibacillus dissolubilis]|uniref:hypothetical protein n=1 Tax=Brevibacillus dissolubilis TaxID=1844116 RepID=UPI001116EB89|nr:hypothetical protein [Brevibacillus dissolubilis]
MSKIIWVFVMVGLLPSIPAFVHILIGAPGEATGAVMGGGFGGISRLTKTMRGMREEGRVSGVSSVGRSVSGPMAGTGESGASSVQGNPISNIGKGLRSIVDTPFTSDGLKQLWGSAAKAGAKGVLKGTGTALVAGVGAGLGAIVTAATGNADLGFSTVGSGMKGVERIRQNPIVQSTGQAVKQWGIDQLSRFTGGSEAYSSNGKSYSELSLEMQVQFGNATNWMNRLEGGQVSSAYHASPKREPETTGTTSVRRPSRGLDQPSYRYVPYEEQMKKMIQAQNKDELRRGMMSPASSPMAVNPVDATTKGEMRSGDHGGDVTISPSSRGDRAVATSKEPVVPSGSHTGQAASSSRPAISPYTNQPMIPYKPKGTDYTSQVLNDPYGVAHRDAKYRQGTDASSKENRHRHTQRASVGQVVHGKNAPHVATSNRPSSESSSSTQKRANPGKSHESHHENHTKSTRPVPFNATQITNIGKPPTKK